MTDKPLLQVKNLQTCFYTPWGVVRAVDGIDFHVDRGEVLGIVGESGSGKTVTSLSVLRLVPKPGGRIAGGEILFKGKNLLEKSEQEMRKIRGSQVTMIPQDPMTSLNPVYRIENQIGEPLALHKGLKKSSLKKRVMDLLKMVHIPSPEGRMRSYPHQFSGGMKQRAIIAMCVSCQPDLIIADEPTTALDVTIQAQILKLLKDLQSRMNTAIIFITHDLGVVASLCSRVAVMYAGVIVEEADVKTIFKNPIHPYTQGLIGSVPKRGKGDERLFTIEGQPPNLLNIPVGCRFEPRCFLSNERCRQEDPKTEWISPGHRTKCFRWRESMGPSRL